MDDKVYKMDQKHIFILVVTPNTTFYIKQVKILIKKIISLEPENYWRGAQNE